EDDAILAAMLCVIIDEQLYDADFVRENVDGLDALRAAVSQFSVTDVAAKAGVTPEEIISAARIFAQAKRGFAFAGTGPNMSAPGTFIEYLVLNLLTLCGYWLRAGESMKNLPSLLPTPIPKAQASPPRKARGFGVQFRTRGLTQTP